MAQKLGSISPVKGLEKLYVFDAGSLRCVALQLTGGGLCLYNPVQGLSTVSAEDLQDLGSIKYLLAPNHYHNRALREYSDYFTAAKVCGSRAATPRLKKLTRLELIGLTGLKRKLPAAVSLIEPQGLKTGEVWLRVKQSNQICWIVGDAFCGPAKGNRNSFSAMPELLKPFPTYGIGNRTEYVAWVTSQIEADLPTTVVPCHGGLIRSKQLPQKLLKLVSQKI